MSFDFEFGIFDIGPLPPAPCSTSPAHSMCLNQQYSLNLHHAANSNIRSHHHPQRSGKY